MADLRGKQLGNYRLIRMLGHGGFGDVYLGTHVHLERRSVAIKVVHPYLSQWEENAFQIEAQRLVDLEHPNIVQILDFGIEADLSYLVMDYAPNGSLRELHPTGSRLPLDTIVFYVKHLADALQYVHERKLIHRDIKPANILLGSKNNLLLSDVGVAIVAHGESSFSLQQAGGTPSYMAPEQAEGEAVPASDQYSLSIMVYEWLCGELPFTSTKTDRRAMLKDLEKQHKSVPPPPLRDKIPTISPLLERVVLKALDKEPKQRYPTVLEFAIDLEQASQKATVSLTDEYRIAQPQFPVQPSAQPETLIEPVAPPSVVPHKPIRPKKYLYVGLIALLIALVGSSLVLYVPALFQQKGPQLNSVVGQVKFVPPGSYDEVQIIILHSIGNAPLGMHYYAWLAFSTGAKPLSWPLTTTQNGQVSSTPYPVSKGRNLLLLVDFFLITREGPGSVDIFPTPILGDRLYYANISSTKSSFDIMPCPPTSSDDICRTKLI
jgi:serine/threonine protein kinase